MKATITSMAVKVCLSILLGYCWIGSTIGEEIHACVKLTGYAENRTAFDAGKLELIQLDGTLTILGSITGLVPGPHGMHIHENGDVTDACTKTGVHFNPLGKNHGGLIDATRHIGDLGNIVADVNGKAAVNITTNEVKLYGTYAVLHRSIVVHANNDDYGQLENNEESKKTGNSGKKIACGLIDLTPENQWSPIIAEASATEAAMTIAGTVNTVKETGSLTAAAASAKAEAIADKTSAGNSLMASMLLCQLFVAFILFVAPTIIV